MDGNRKGKEKEKGKTRKDREARTRSVKTWLKKSLSPTRGEKKGHHPIERMTRDITDSQKRHFERDIRRNSHSS